MKLVFLYGVPATGKLTVARELALLTGYKLFHNHLAVDLLLAVFEFGSPSFIRLREEIWLAVFEEASRSGIPGLIFTFAPEPTVRPQFIPVALDAMTRSGGEMDFVELVCPLAELRNRIDHPSRMRFQKLTSLTLFEQLHSKGAFDSSQLPQARLVIDTSACDPGEAATRIVETLGLARLERSVAPDPGA